MNHQRFRKSTDDAASELAPKDLLRGLFISAGKLGYAAPSSDPLPLGAST